MSSTTDCLFRDCTQRCTTRSWEVVLVPTVPLNFDWFVHVPHTVKQWSSGLPISQYGNLSLSVKSVHDFEVDRVNAGCAGTEVGLWSFREPNGYFSRFSGIVHHSSAKQQTLAARHIFPWVKEKFGTKTSPQKHDMELLKCLDMAHPATLTTLQPPTEQEDGFYHSLYSFDMKTTSGLLPSDTVTANEAATVDAAEQNSFFESSKNSLFPNLPKEQ